MLLKNETMKPSISVLITLYNHEKFIEETLKSALSQTLPPDEIVVIDDFSTDNSLAIVQSIHHPSILIQSEKVNLGGPNTMKGMELCRGDYVAILNSDDTWQEDKLLKQIDYLNKHPKCGVIFTHINLIDENSSSWEGGTNKLYTLFHTKNTDRHSWLKRFFNVGNFFCASSAIIRRDCLDKVGLFDGRYIQLQDFDMWLRIALSGYDIHVIQKPFTNYRIKSDGSNMSAPILANKSLFAFEFSRILRNFWRICSLKELVAIFPEIEVSKDADDSLVLFYLAIYASERPAVQYQLFAMETMIQWGGDIHSMTIANRCHGFSHFEYRNFLANGPIRGILSRTWKGRIEYVANKYLPYHLQQFFKEKIMHILKETLNK